MRKIVFCSICLNEISKCICEKDMELETKVVEPEETKIEKKKEK